MKSQLPNVPLTIVSNTHSKWMETQIVMGTYGRPNYLKVPKPLDEDGEYWMVIFDRSSLQVVENFMFSENTIIPTKAKPFLGNSDYFYVLTTQSIPFLKVPTGALYKWLRSEGAGVGLKTIEQAFNSLNQNGWTNFSYTLIDVFGEMTNTLDYYNLQNASLLTTIELRPFDVSGKTLYSPLALSR